MSVRLLERVKLESALENRAVSAAGTLLLLLLTLLAVGLVSTTLEVSVKEMKELIIRISPPKPSPPPQTQQPRSDKRGSRVPAPPNPATPRQIRLPSQTRPSSAANTSRRDLIEVSSELSGRIDAPGRSSATQPRLSGSLAAVVGGGGRGTSLLEGDGAGLGDIGVEGGGDGDGIGGGEGPGGGEGLGPGGGGGHAGLMGAEGAGRIPLIDERRCKKRLEDPELDALADWLRKHGKPICPSLRLAVAWTSGDLTTVEDFRIGGSAGQTYRLYVLLRPESRVLKVLLVDQELNASRVVDQRQDRPQDYSSGYAVYNNPADPRCGDLELQAGNPQAPSSTQTLRLFQSWWKSVRPKG